MEEVYCGATGPNTTTSSLIPGPHGRRESAFSHVAWERGHTTRYMYATQFIYNIILNFDGM